MEAKTDRAKREPRSLSPDGRVMTLREFSANYGLCRTTLYEMMKAGRLRAIKLGGRTMIRRDDADAWLDAQPTYRPQSARAA